ncbi:MAG: exodeoxyribonuclease VII large subunit [Gammaproteobacteria bacterium]
MPAPSRDILSVTRLNRAVRALLEGHFGAVWVEGEISNLARPSSGHWYFSLKDPSAQVRCAMFRARNALVGFTPANGAQVMVSARVSMYEPRGEFQLIVEHMEPAGEGLLRLRLEALKRRLAEAGMFDAGRKRVPPHWPTCIGVITSPTGAALRDILHVLARRNRAVPVIVYPTAVQGAAAVPGIVSALETANRRAECAVLILARGGGSLEDLWAFNEEAVVRAIYGSRIPVVTGVGHEIDFTLADLVADVRAPTPSAAAELCAPDGRQVLRQLAQFEQRLLGMQRAHLTHRELRLQTLIHRLVHPGRRIEQYQQRLDEIDRRLPLAMQRAQALVAQRLQSATLRLRRQDPTPRVRLLAQRLAQASTRLPFALRAQLERRAARIASLEQTLAAVSPRATLSRGYAIVTDAAGRVVRDARGVVPGAAIRARVARGSLDCVVERSQDDDR